MSPNKTEEDLDDLDDVLEEFTKPAPQPSRPTVTDSSSQSPIPALSTSAKKPLAEVEDDSEFAKRLTEEMELMMRALGHGNLPETPAPSTSNSQPAITEAEELKAFREEWERMIIQELEGGGKGNSLIPDPSAIAEGKDKHPESSSSAPSSSSSAAKPTAATDSKDKDAFQKAIHQAMNKIQDSDESLKADLQNGPAGEDALKSLLSSLGELNLGADGENEGGEGGEGFASMLESMMSELMSKEILYEPLKELDSKYPEYLATNGATLSSDDLKRHTAQQECVSKLVAIFEMPSYSDDNAEQSMEVLTLMNEMQTYGSPPAEIMGDMPAGLEPGPDGLPQLPEGCVVT